LPWQDCPILAVRWLYIALITFLKPSTLFQSELDTPRIFHLLLARGGSGSPYVRGFAGGGGGGRAIQTCGNNPLDSVMP